VLRRHFSKNGQCLANEGKKGFRVSKYLQELGCYVGQQLTFDEASENLKRIGGITLSDKQIERIQIWRGIRDVPERR
jgi:hypothetical protein